MKFTDIPALRLFNQKLLEEKLESAEEVVSWLGAVQSQDFAGAKWALGQRVQNTSDATITKLYNDGKILRTHVLRPTWHFVLPEDISWLLELTAPRVKKLMAYYDRKLDIDQKLITKVEKLFIDALSSGKYLTRAELEKVLDAGGIKAHGQKLGHLVGHAELDQIICSGPLRGKQFTYALLSERVPNTSTVTRDEALAELARRYFQSHGPALVHDFAWWSGLTMTDSSKAVQLAKLQNTEVSGKTYWHTALGPVPKLKTPLLQLLPNYDEYLISYKDYTPIFSGEVKGLAKQFGNALVAHIIVRDGLVIGGWRRMPQKNKINVVIEPLVRLSASDQQGIHQAVESYSRFVKTEVEVIEKSM